MATLSAWKFDTPDGAADAESILIGLSKQELITIHDAAMSGSFAGGARARRG